MSNIVLGSVLAAAYIILFWFLGALLPEKYQSHSVPVMCMTGFLLYYALFQLVALPMKLATWSLSRLTIIWCTILLLCGLLVIVRRWRTLLFCLKEMLTLPSKVVVILLLTAGSLGLALLLGFNTNSISDYDAGYYIGLPTSSTYSNTLNLMSPYTGLLADASDSFYILNTDTLHSAIIYQVLNLHPLIERKWSFTIAMVLLFQMCLYQCGKMLFDEHYGKTSIFVLLADLTLLFSYSIAGVSHYFAYRTYEGKAITSYFYMAAIFCFCTTIYKYKKAPWAWIALFFCGVGGIAFSNTALYVVPGMIGFMLAPLVFWKGLFHRKPALVGNFLLVLIPCIVWIMLQQILS